MTRLKYLTLSACTLFVIGVVGCGSDNNNAGTGNGGHGGTTGAAGHGGTGGGNAGTGGGAAGTGGGAAGTGGGAAGTGGLMCQAMEACTAGDTCEGTCNRQGLRLECACPTNGQLLCTTVRCPMDAGADTGTDGGTPTCAAGTSTGDNCNTQN